MTEVSIIWPGSAVGDAQNAPLLPDDIAKAFYYFFEFLPHPLLGYIDGNGAYESRPDVIFVSGKTIYLAGAVIGGYLNGLRVTNPAGLNIQIDTGGAIVDGRVYIANTAPLTQAIAAPVAGSNYYLFGIRSTYAAQTVEAFFSGPQPSIADLTQATTIGGVYEMVLAVVQITSGSVITISDCRRLISPNGYQQMQIAKRQGSSSSDWSLAGSNNYEVGGDIIALALTRQQPYALSPADQSPIILANAVGNDPTLAAAAKTASLMESVIVDNFSGAYSVNPTSFYAFILGSDNPARFTSQAIYQNLAWGYTEENY